MIVEAMMPRKARMASQMNLVLRSCQIRTRPASIMSGTTIIKNFVAAVVGSMNWSWTFSSVRVLQLGYQKNFSDHITPT